MGCSAPKAMAHNAISHVPVVMCRIGLLTIQSNNTVSSPTAIRDAVYNLVKELSLPLLRRSFSHTLRGTSVIATPCAKRPIPTPIPPTPPAPGNLPPPQDSGIDHIVIVTMENRSFDHFLGWLPHANTWTSQRPDLTFADSSGKRYPPQNLGSDYTGCGHPAR